MKFSEMRANTKTNINTKFDEYEETDCKTILKNVFRNFTEDCMLFDNNGCHYITSNITISIERVINNSAIANINGRKFVTFKLDNHMVAAKKIITAICSM